VPVTGQHFLMSNTAARWTLIAVLAAITLLTITITSRLDGALNDPTQTVTQSAG
jgi:hypothetical protein